MITSTPRSRLLLAPAALLLAAGLHAQSAAPAPAAAPAPTPAATTPDQTIVLSPFEVSTSSDNGYAATNEISGSRVNTPIKDIPVPIDVITSQFIDDTNATDLRSALTYTSGIMLQTQNDLENTGATYGSPYGPGGVNNPQGLTANIDESQLKLRGFVTTNVLRDGFLREAASDSINIDRIEVVYGPNALLYGTGNFGGVVDYLTKPALNTPQGDVTVGVGTYGYLRTTVSDTGPMVASQHLDYRIDGSWEQSSTNIHDQKNSHFFLSPSISWSPTPKTNVLVDLEYGRSKQNGYGFQALRAVEGSGATPINNDQIEAVSFFFPPGANPRTFNLSGPDTFNDQQVTNLEIKGTQRLLDETTWLPEIDALLGYNHSRTAFQLQNVNGEINGPIAAGAPGFGLAQTIYTTSSANSIGGQGSDNLNLVFGPLPAAVVEYQWYQNDQSATRDQERAELTARKTVGAGHWYEFNDQVLGGFSALKNDLGSAYWETVPGDYNYKKPNELNPIRFAAQGDGTANAPEFQSDENNINRGWDAAYYLNNYAKLFDGRLILMNGIRHDKLDAWSTDTPVDPNSRLGTTTTSRSTTQVGKSYQNGVELALTKFLSFYGLKAEGLEPNFGGLHDAISGSPVGANQAKSRELGIKFDFFNGKLSGRVSHYTITKTSWEAEPWWVPAPLGHTLFNPNKDIVYELSGGFNANVQPGAAQNFPGISSQGAPVQNNPQVVSAWNAAVASGAVYTLPGFANRLYLDASKPTGAAYLDTAFAVNQASGGAWPGWLYQGESENDPNINNATMDASGFSKASQQPAWQVIDQSKGWDGQLIYTPNTHLQFVFDASIDAKVNRLSLGTWPQYPYPQDRWAVWYFQNGSWGLEGEPLNVAYANPQNTATRTNAGVYPGDDTPRYAWDLWSDYKFGRELPGWSVGLGLIWHAQEEFFSGVTHGGGQIEQNSAGQTIIAYSPSQLLVNLMIKKDFKWAGHAQFVQLNLDNVTDDTKLYGLIYQTPLQARVTYGFAF